MTEAVIMPTQDPIYRQGLTLDQLVTPRTHRILNGTEVHINAEESLRYVAREVAGWTNFAQKYEIPLTGDAKALIEQAREMLEIEVSRAEALLRAENLENAVPSTVYKESSEKEEYSELSAWLHIAKINKDVFLANCPDDIREQVATERDAALHEVERAAPVSSEPEAETEERLESARASAQSEVESENGGIESELERKGRANDFSQGTSETVQESSPGQSQTESEANIPVNPHEIAVDVEVPTNSGQIEIDRTLAKLGRNVVAATNPPIDQDSNQTVNGRATHTIVLNVTTNTLKIYAKDRGGELILTDINGKIDHDNSKATQKDIEVFQRALARLQESQKQQVQSKRQAVGLKH